MIRWTRFVPVVAVALLLGACGDGSGGDTPLAPEGPRMTAGGSGGGQTAGTTSTMSTTTTTAPQDTTSRSGGGGWTVGGT